MALPKYFDAAHVWAHPDPNYILEYTQISDWVPAAIVLGLVSRVIFIEPPWNIDFHKLGHPSIVLTIGNIDGDYVHLAAHIACT